MIEIKVNDFGKNIVSKLFNFFDEVREKDIFEKLNSIYRSKFQYDGFWYEIKINESEIAVLFSKTNNEHSIDILSVPMLPSAHSSNMSSKDLDRLINAIANRVVVFDVSMLKKMKQDLNVNILNESYSILEKELEKYYSSMVDDINVIFESSENFKKTIVLNDGDDHYHKYEINGKQVVVFSNTSCIEEYFTIYEKDSKTDTIRIVNGTVAEIYKNKNYKIRTIVIGKYPNIIEDYLKNKHPICVIEKNEVKYINKINEILELNYHAKDLSSKYKLKRKLPYNRENMKEMLNYLTFDNMYTLLTHGLWSINGKWEKNNKEEYFFVFESEIETFKDHDKMVYEEDGLKYVSITRKDAAMLSLPAGNLKEEWKDLIVESYFYIKDNKKSLPLCEISDQEFSKVEKYLKNNKYI